MAGLSWSKQVLQQWGRIAMVFIGPPNQMLPNERSIGETAAYSKKVFVKR